MAGRGWEQAPGRPSSCSTDREAFFLLHRPSWQTFFVFCNDGRSQPHWLLIWSCVFLFTCFVLRGQFHWNLRK